MDLPKTPSFRLDGRRALVTGGSSGIGLGCAVALADAGAHTVLAARRQAELDAAVAELTARGASAEALVLDVSDIEAVADAVQAGGPFDVLVNSAGSARHSAAVDTDPADFDTVMGLNVRGAYFLTREVAKGLIAAGRPGSLINISSQMGTVGGP
ncbi:MAG: SDR family NAD(P)-dependent oxidoreductase, partial [Pseudomonadota bacterium]